MEPCKAATAAGRNQCKNGYFFCPNPLSCARNEQAVVDRRRRGRAVFVRADFQFAGHRTGHRLVRRGGIEGHPQIQARPRADGRAHDRHDRPRNPAPHPRRRPQAARDFDDRLRHHADRHRGDEARRLRLSAQAVRRAQAQGNHRQRAQGRARHETGRVVSAAARIRGLRTGHRRAQRADAAGFQAHRPGRRDRRHRARHRRERHRQGTRRPRDLPPQQPQPAAVPRGELRGDSRAIAGKRIVRPRERLVHRRNHAAHRQIRAVQQRHDFSR